MNKFNKYKNEKGITLVILVLTILVMIIFVGVSAKAIIKQADPDKAKNIVEKAQNGINTAENQAENIDADWSNSPGKPIKSNTIL